MKINSAQKDTLYLFVLQGMNYAIPILIMPYLMIKLGVNSYGLIGFSTAIIQFLILFVDFGFNMSATKRIAVYKDDKLALSRVFYSTIFAKCILLFVSICILITIMMIPNFYDYRLALLCSSLALIGNTFTFTWFYQGVGYIRFLSILSMFCRILILPTLFYFVQTNQDYIKAIFINSLVYGVIAFVSTIWIFKKHMVTKVKISFGNVKFELKESFPFFLSTASISIYTQLFVVILGFFSTSAAVGVYTAADKIIRAISLLFYTPINQVYYPKIASISSYDRKQALGLLKKIFKFSVGVMIILSLTVFIFSSLIERFLGVEYDGIGNLLKILSLVPVVAAIGGVAGQMGLIAYIDNAKSKKTFQNIYIVAGVFAICQVSFFAYLYHAVGASIAMLLTESLVAILMLYYFRKYYKDEIEKNDFNQRIK
ncbi:oligosaccharide flippase family protein [Acinetobacter bereziniae]|uniref:oligosaccharide flippase family protein n=1 Tax=Acinetobacter bereziniae TaxID=106648 RepID=UPI0006699386|nr:oligosaccharide flippase family protein [Acinetobacter bereziniae]MBJ8445339.1 oligosaccharide flippase family protein [Acinetobacter bereziniae]MBJ8476166.1 oligosaccharide flippase family protein [Acinetobacter bereziniae]